MTTDAFNNKIQRIGCRQNSTGFGADFSEFAVVPKVNTINFINTFQATVFDHIGGAPVFFFRRLKNKPQPTMEKFFFIG